jgi:hypothetical protein
MFLNFFRYIFIFVLQIVPFAGLLADNFDHTNENLLYTSPQKGGEVGNAVLGFKFLPPEGWVAQVTDEGIMLGHNSIPGLIIIFPNEVKNISQMKADMQDGLHDAGTDLVLKGGVSSYGKNSLIANYEGFVDGTKAIAKGIGVLSKTGNGAYILAVSTPEAYSAQLTEAAKSIAGRIKFINDLDKGKDVSSEELMKHFIGKWSTVTSNTATDIYLYPNGVYSENYEASYSGNYSDGGGNNTGSWGKGAYDNVTGSWSVKGNKDKGVLMIRYPDGEKARINYQVHVERGKKYYNEYYFDGILYWKTSFR